MRTLLEDKRLLLKAGAIVDATIIEASRQRMPGARDPEMHQIVKGGA